MTKTSTALLVAWFVVIAGLIAAIVFFSMKGCAPTPSEPDAATVKVEPRPKIQPRTQSQPRHPGGGQSRPNGPGAAPKHFVIEGIVRIPGGDPVAGAHVALYEPTKPGKPLGPGNPDELNLLSSVIYIAPEEGDTPRPLSQWTGAGQSAGQAAETEITGEDAKADGTFAITLPSGRGAGPYRLTASKENVGRATANEVTAGGDKVDLMLGPASSVKGIVLTELDSLPVQGATVVFDNGARRFPAETDAAGAFTAEGVTPGYYQLSVAAVGRTPLFEKQYKVEPVNLNPITLRMPRGTKLTVKAVVEKDDPAAAARKKGEIPSDPIPGAQIVAFSEDTNAYVLGKTNAEGFVEFAAIPGGHWNLNGLAKGFVSMGEVAVIVDKNQLAQEETVSFEKAVDTPVEVVDEDGRPVAGVEFYTVNNDDKYDQVRSMRVGATDSDGKMKFPFEFDGPRAQLFGFKQGFAVVRAAPDDHESGDPLKLVAKKALRVHGSVKTTEGRAVPDALVAIDVSPTDPNEAASQDYSLQIRTDADGRYDFPYLPRIDGITLSASGPDGISGEDKDVELAAGKNDYELDLVLDVDDTTPVVVAPKTKKPDMPVKQQK